MEKLVQDNRITVSMEVRTSNGKERLCISLNVFKSLTLLPSSSPFLSFILALISLIKSLYFFLFSSFLSKVELSTSALRYKNDFFRNRGVPEFLLVVLSDVLSPAQWKELKSAVECNVDSNNTRKSSMVKLGKDTEVDVKKLGAENISDTYKDDSETTATNIVSAHGVPPLLANILIPGKMGSTNELPNALMAFQILLISKRQRIISKVLRSTLGKELKIPDKYLNLRRLTDLLNLEGMDTVARMKEPLVGSNRDISEGLKD
jgi:hypothetical protein